jgi:hypothetical protein
MTDLADIKLKPKVCCERCSTVFYVLGDTLECPKCSNMVDQYYKFNKHNGNKDESDYYDDETTEEDESQEVFKDDSYDV